jgi:hypothetical protein
MKQLSKIPELKAGNGKFSRKFVNNFALTGVLKKIRDFFKVIWNWGMPEKTPYCDGWNYVTCVANGHVEWCRKHNPVWERECREASDEGFRKHIPDQEKRCWESSKGERT